MNILIGNFILQKCKGKFILFDKNQLNCLNKKNFQAFFKFHLIFETRILIQFQLFIEFYRCFSLKSSAFSTFIMNFFNLDISTDRKLKFCIQFLNHNAIIIHSTFTLFTSKPVIINFRFLTILQNLIIFEELIFKKQNHKICAKTKISLK